MGFSTWKLPECWAWWLLLVIGVILLGAGVRKWLMLWWQGLFLVIAVVCVIAGIRMGVSWDIWGQLFNSRGTSKEDIETIMLFIGFGAVLINTVFIIIRIRKTDEQISESKKQLKKAEEQSFMTIFQKGMDMLFAHNRIEPTVSVDYLGDLLEDNKDNPRAVGQIFRVFQSYVREADTGGETSNAVVIKFKIIQYIIRYRTKYEGEINFQGAYLHMCPTLEGGNLEGVDLRGANWSSAALIEVNLEGANLEGANLGSELRSVNLRGANLRKAHLQYARLQETDLQDANLQDTNLRGAYLLYVRNFDTVQSLDGAKLDYALFSFYVYDSDGKPKCTEDKQPITTQSCVENKRHRNVHGVETIIYYAKDSKTFRFGRNSNLSKEQLIGELQGHATKLAGELLEVVQHQIEFIDKNF